MIRLGFMLVRGGGRRAVFRLALIALGTATGVCALLLALTFPALLSTRQDRAERRIPYSGSQKHNRGWIHPAKRFVGTRPLEVLFVAKTVASPLPPGVTELPGPGEAVVSPALAEILGQEVELAQLFPNGITALITSEGLVSPNELYAYVGRTRAQLPDVARPLGGFGGDLNPEVDIAAGDLKVVLLSFLGLVGIPLAAYFAVCSRLSAATRNRRIAALRLVGLDAKRTRRLSALEPVVAAVAGSLLGLGLFILLNPLLASSGLGGLEWFPQDSRPGAGALLLCAVIVPAFAGVLSVIASRDAVTNALSVRRQTPAPDRSPWRLLPLIAGTGLLGGLLVLSLSDSVLPARVGDWALLAMLAGGALTAFGLAFGFTMLPIGIGRAIARRTDRPWLLLGVRRLEFEPSSVTRVVSGLVIVVFGMGFANGLQRDARAANSQVGNQQLYALDVVEVPVEARDDLLDSGVAPAALVFLDSKAKSPPLGAGPPPPSARPLRAVWATCDSVEKFTDSSVPACEDERAYVFARSDASKIRDPGAVARFPLEIRRTDAGPLFTRRLPKATLRLSRRSLERIGDPDLLYPIDKLPEGRVPESASVQFASAADASSVERVVAAIASLAPTATLRFLNEDVEAQARAVVTQKLLHVALLLGVFVGFSAFVVAALDRALERRQNLTALSMVGVPTRTLRGAQAVQVGLPLMVASVVAIASGKLMEQAVVLVGGYTRSWAWGGTGLAALVALIALATAIAMTTLTVSSKIDVSLIRRE